jgi:GNAT superfamily N-acetyltransferase
MSVEVREARLEDARALARVEVESWRDTYPTPLPNSYLLRTLRFGPAGTFWRQRLTDNTDDTTLVIVSRPTPNRICGFARFGMNRTVNLPFEGEVYAIYILPAVMGHGYGRRLLTAVGGRLIEADRSSLCVEVLERNPNRFFYNAMGARLAANKTHWFGGANLPTLVYGWDDISVLARERAEDTP